MFRFADPENLRWLVLVVLLFVISIFCQKQMQKKLKIAFGERLSPFLTQSLSLSRRRFKNLLQGLVLASLVFAWARPQSGQSKEEIKSEGIELVLLVDVSESMMADDVRPNRLEQAKIDLSRMVDIMAGNKIALVAFAGSAALLSPLTTDPSSLKLFIDSLAPSSVSTQGTNFAQALEEARGAFKRGSTAAEDNSHVSRAVVILSDGEDHEPGAHKVAETMVADGIRIFTVAYGTQKGAPIPERDSLGYLKGYKKDRSGNTVLTTVNGDELKKLADSGKGQFFFASPGADYLKRIAEAINQLEKSQFDTSISLQYQEIFQNFLIVTFLLGLLEMGLGERKAPFRLWRGRFEVPPQ
jgi:Ca-activated chloride channel family protein